MSNLLAILALPVIALIAQSISIDAGLWAAIAVCVALIARLRKSRSRAPTVLASAAAMLLTSLALVTA